MMEQAIWPLVLEGLKFKALVKVLKALVKVLAGWPS